MTPQLCTLMAQYNRWMNLRLYEAAAKLAPEALFAHRGAFFGSLFDTLNHIVAADLIWLHRFARHLGPAALPMQGLPSPGALTERMAASLEELQALRAQTDEIVITLADQVQPQHLASVIRYTDTLGQSQAKNFGLLLQHFFNHQTHHRGQATTLLFQAGVDIGVTDLAALIPSEQ